MNSKYPAEQFSPSSSYNNNSIIHGIKKYFFSSVIRVSSFYDIPNAFICIFLLKTSNFLSTLLNNYYFYSVLNRREALFIVLHEALQSPSLKSLYNFVSFFFIYGLIFRQLCRFFLRM